MAQITSVTYDFLKDVAKNNHKEWFHANKPRYEAAHQEMIAFADDLLSNVSEFDVLETASGKKSLFRIYRDVRFSKDKSPYKPRWAGGFSRVKPHLRGGYYFQLKPGGSIVGGGFFGPNSDDLKLLRGQIAQDDEPLRNVVESASFKDVFGALQGDQVKTAPKGFDKEHPAIDLLRYKSMYAFHEFTDEEVMAPDFAEKVVGVWLAIRPFFDVMTEMLTTDLNGLSLLDD